MMLLVCCVFALLSSSIKANDLISYDDSPGVTKATCGETETSCGNSCCPHPNAVCCNETQTCCREGTICLGSISYCLGLKLDGESPSVYSERSTVLKGTDCPSWMTTCYDKCCPLPDAVCCSDEMTCCPDGTTCGPVGSKTCKTGVDAVVSFLKAVLRKSMEIPSTNTFNYALPQSRPIVPIAGDNCCEAWFGYICCQYPSVCTTLGCM